MDALDLLQFPENKETSSPPFTTLKFRFVLRMQTQNLRRKKRITKRE